MTSLTDTQVITASGGLVELGVGTATSNVVVNVGFPSATTIIPNVPVVTDGSPVELKFDAPFAYPGAASATLTIGLYRDGTELVRAWNTVQTTSTQGTPISCSFRDTPTAGSHTYSVRGYRDGNAWTLYAGGIAYSSMTLRVSKIVTATQWPAVTTGTIICTSSTRPAAPFPGQKIYETDTKKELTYDGTSWAQPWNQPWGVIGIGEHTTGASVPANTSFCSVTFTPVLNRYYQAFYTCRTVWTTAGTIGIFDSVANGRIAEQYGAPDPVTLQRTKTFSSTASRTLSIRTDGVQTPISGPYSGQERPAQLVVMDVGPA